MTDLAAFPDVELLVRQALLDLPVEGLTIGTVVPADPDGTLDWLPFVRIQCIGGPGGLITDVSTVDVDVFATDKGTASQIARLAQQLLISGPTRTSAGVLDRCVTASKPRYIPYVDSPPPYRFTATYTTSARR